MPEVTDPALLSQLGNGMTPIGSPDPTIPNRVELQRLQIEAARQRIGAAPTANERALREALLKAQVDKARADAEKARGGTAGAQVGDAKMQQRLANLNALERQLAQVRGLYESNLQGGWPNVIAGNLPDAVRPENGEFESAAAGLGEIGLAAFRVPGVGSQSDAELKQFVAANTPLPGDSDKKIEQKLRNLETRLNATREAMGVAPQRQSRQEDPDPIERAQNVTTDAGYRRDPALAGVERKYRQMLGAGASAGELLGFLDRAGIKGISPTAVMEQVRFRQQNPQVPLSSYDTAPIAQKWHDGSGIIGSIADSPVGAYGVAAANALTAGTLDEIVGATGGNQEQAQLTKDILRERSPGASIAGDVTGAALGMTGVNAGLRGAGGGLAQLSTRGGGIGADALYGGLYGAGENNDNRLGGFAMGAGAGAGGNLIGRGLVSGAGRLTRGVSDPAIRALNERGIPMTPGQVLGEGGALRRGIRKIEDAIESVPFLGSAISNRREEGLRAFNQEAFKDALAPIQQQVEGQVGQDAIANAQDLVSGAYGSALDGVSMRADLPFVQQAGDAVRAGQRIPEFGEDISYLLRENLGPTFGPGRTLSGEGFQSSLQDIADVTADFRKAGNVRGRNAANAMGDLRQAYFGLANRQAPGTTQGLASANEANRNISVLGDAVMRALNSNVDSGVFTPAQLGRAAVANTKKFGGARKAAAGDVPFRALQEAGQSVLPSTVPNSGTTDRALATYILPTALGGSAMGAEQLNAPAPVVGALATMGFLSTKSGNKLLQKLALGRSDTARVIGERLLDYRRPGGVIGGALMLPPTINQ